MENTETGFKTKKIDKAFAERLFEIFQFTDEKELEWHVERKLGEAYLCVKEPDAELIAELTEEYLRNSGQAE